MSAIEIGLINDPPREQGLLGADVAGTETLTQMIAVVKFVRALAIGNSQGCNSPPESVAACCAT